MVVTGLLMAVGVKYQFGEMELITIGAAVTVMFPVADLVESLTAIAVQVAGPVAVGENTPEEVIVPLDAV
jgi:hypothetical protein